MAHLIDAFAVSEYLVPHIQRCSNRASCVPGGRLNKQPGKTGASLNSRHRQTVKRNPSGNTQIVLAGSLTVTNGDFAKNVFNPCLHTSGQVSMLLCDRLVLCT